jgi:hypothetical protein
LIKNHIKVVPGKPEYFIEAQGEIRTITILTLGRNKNCYPCPNNHLSAAIP